MIPSTLSPIIAEIENEKGTAYIVGGFVRDHLFHKEHGVKNVSKDIDFEVYGLPLDSLKKILSKHGEVQECGKSFGVLKLAKDGEVYDFALPRSDSKASSGHQGFIVNTDPHMNPEAATKRRNFTVNSAMINAHTHELFDPNGAVQDIKMKTLRPTDPFQYGDDPLRNLIGLQQSVRFGFTPNFSDYMVYAAASTEYYSLSIERIWEEWRKLFSKGICFKGFFNAIPLLALNEIYPELHAMLFCEQDPEWHPEGNAAVHSELSAEWAVKHCLSNSVEGEDRLVLVAAALLHDIGKPLVTTVDPEDGKIRSKGHDTAAIEFNGNPGPLITFLHRIGMPEHLQKRIIPLVKEHMVHVGGTLEKKTVRRIANRIYPATISELDLIIQADHAARPPLSSMHPCPELMLHALALDVDAAKPIPILQGRDLIKCGIKPGPEMGELLRKAFELQLDGAFDTVDGGLKLILGGE